jgi:hypothetical protein
LNQWTLLEPAAADRTGLIEATERHARHLGTAALAAKQPIMATGHQPWLWHPGILAKDLALAAAAPARHAQAMHLVVDHDVQPALTLEVPRETGSKLELQRIRLGPQQQAVPTGFHPPIDADAALTRLAEANQAHQLDRLIEAWTDLPPCRTLAEQLAVVLDRLKRPIVGPQAVLMVSDLPQLPAWQALIEQMRIAPRPCALAYNRAIAANPTAGVPALAVTSDWVELPLWACAWGRPRRRVLADVTAEPTLLVTPDGEPIDPSETSLLPRALSLTAFMRSTLCGFFIHGRGGGVYDRATEAWWHDWQGTALAPAAVVSADARLPFNAPTADRRELAGARWQAHHAPHNVDRWLGLDGPLAREKQRLLQQMAQARDRAGRRMTFRAIHRLNRELVRRHPEVVDQTRQRVASARQGLANRRVAEKRDWCFALYRLSEFEAIRQSLLHTGGNHH